MTPSQLVKARVRLGYRFRKDLAQAIGVSVYAVNSWETGKRTIPAWLPVLIKCLRAQRER